MKILYVGHWKNGTGWGNAAQNNILALDKAGIEVVPRAMADKPTSHEVDIPDRLLELEQNDESNCDICIQHVLPHTMEYSGKFEKNIGIYYSETSNFRNTQWASHLNMMDQVWVANKSMVDAAISSYVTAPIAVVNLCADVSLYSQRYEPYPIPGTDDNFVFYTAGTVTRRKNLMGLLKAFHLEFGINEPVSLLIKGNVPGESPMESNRIITSMITEVKNSLRLYPKETDYHNEIIITEWLDQNKMMRLHRTGDCFVLPSYGEAWGMPGFDAMGMGNPVILTNEGGPADYVLDGTSSKSVFCSGLLIPCRQEPVFIRPEEAPLPDLWTSSECWQSPDLLALQKIMREVYENKELRSKLGENGIDRAYEFSLDIVGKRMKGLLDGTIEPTLYDRATALREKHDMSDMATRIK